MSYYVMQNAEVIGEICRLNRLTDANVDSFWFRVDRIKRVVIDDRSGTVYPIPDDWNLS